MADDRRSTGTRDAPGTLTSLIEEVVRGAGDGAGREGGGAWTDGMRSGTVIGRYELIREVGRGGFGVVWEARDRELGRTVAFKALRARGEVAREKRLLAEAEVAARLSHPNIVTVLDVGRSEGGVYLIQEFLSGVSLARRLAEGRLPLREALRVAVEVARGLAHAHAHGVVHRDLTPGNVQLCEDGQVKVLDLGMAAALGRRKVEGGTPAYMAPEQAEGAPEDERTDVYALGVLLYRLLTGVPPVKADASGRPRFASRGLEVPEAPALATLVEAMLARAPTGRPRDAQVVLEALLEIEAALPRGSGGSSRVRVRPPPRTRWVTTGALAGLLAAGVLGVPTALLIGVGRAQPSAPAPAAPQERIFVSSSTLLPCTWRPILNLDLTGPQPELRWRNGKLGEQGPGRRGGRGAWLQSSDWNQLFIPLGAARPDVFQVKASFLPPSDGRSFYASVHVFGDPTGPLDTTSSDVDHGRGILFTQAPDRAPGFKLGVPQGIHTMLDLAQGSLPGTLVGRWHTITIEGSRSRCWLRVLLDGAPLLLDVGACDLVGGSVVLGSNGDPYVPAEVYWRDFILSEGQPSCL